LGKLTSGKNDSCRGMCYEYKNLVVPRNGTYYYKWENARCSICVIYVKWDGIYCPCCGYRLRRRPRGSEAAIKCQTNRGVKRID